MTQPVPPAILEGIISVKAAIQSRNREISYIAIRDDKTESQFVRLAEQAERAGIVVRRVTGDEIDTITSGKTHGGVVAGVGERRFVEMAQLAAGRGWVAMIDGVEDPFNFGQAVRSLYAAGADGLVVRPRNWMSAAGIVARASAGASELIHTAIAETASDAAAFFKLQGYAIACADDGEDSQSLYETDLTKPLFLLIGGEKRGITRSFLDQADLKLQIPYGRTNAESLGTTAAAAVFAFEILRQRTGGALAVKTAIRKPHSRALPGRQRPRR